MPFSKDNIKGTSLVLGIVLIVMVSTIGIVMIARTPHPEPTLYTTVAGFPSVVAMQMLHMLRQVHAEKEIQKTRHDLRNEIQPVQLAVEEVKLQSEHLRTVGREELGAMIREAVRDAMRGDIRQIVREELRNELKGH